MPIFEYTAKKNPAETESGFIEAESYSGAVNKLTQKGLFPVQVKASGEKLALHRESVILSDKMLIFFTREITDLISSGVSLINALQIIAAQNINKKLQFVTMEIMQSVKEGLSFSEALKKFPKIFSSLYINIVKSGEISGQLEQVMLRLAKFHEKKSALKMKIIEALLYPLFLIVLGLCAVSVLVVYVIPKLTPMFEDIGGELPLPTKIIMNISSFLYSYWYLLIIFIIILVFGVMKISRSFYYQSFVERKLLNLPVIGAFKTCRYLSEIFQSLESLISNGITTIEALDVTIESCNFLPYKEALKEIRNDIANGNLFSKSLEKAKIFPAKVSVIVKVGEEGGRLDSAMQKLAVHYTSSFEKAADLITSLLGPFFIIIIAVMVGFIIIAMLLPLLDLNVAL